MSRTTRRKRGDQPSLCTWYDQVSLQGNVFVEMRYLCKGDAEYSTQYRLAHSEEPSGIYGVPRWYRAAINKHVSAKEERQLHRALRAGTEDELIFNPRVKDAGYTWW